MDVEQMHTAASEEYKENYSTGEYCHEQSFLWGFQEGVELAESNSGKELLYVAQKTAERTKKEIINKACKWLRNNIDFYGESKYDEDFRIDIEQLLKDVSKAMEE